MNEASPIQQQGVTPDRVARGPLIDIIAGARPNFMKIAPILHAIQARQAAGSALRFRLVHTGQHYDERMSGGFFGQLGIPQPDVNLEVGSGTQAEQTAGIMVGYEKLLLQQRSDVCLVVGDVTSTMACAIAAQKLGVPVAHVEGGIRSGDWGMPEEINRLVTDAITNWFFTTSEGWFSTCWTCKLMRRHETGFGAMGCRRHSAMTARRWRCRC